MYLSQHLSVKYALVAYLLFTIQGIVAIGGAAALLLPDLAVPISYVSGRAFHLNLSIYWPLLGMIGAVYFFFSEEAALEVSSCKLINVNFWLLVGTISFTLGTLLLGYTEGREYLEALWPFKIATAISTIILSVNLLRTYQKITVPKSRATLVSMLAGSLSLIIFYIPNIISYSHPTVDEIAKFLVVHIWEEMSLELIGTGVLAALLIKVTGAKRQAIEAAVYLDITFMALAGIMATAHHYYWIGVPAFWLWVGGLFSAMQVIPVMILIYTTIKTANIKDFLLLSNRDKITIALIGSSVFYHIFGAGFLGFFMAYPPINRYVHGTYITSAHAHFALFGVFGFLVLAVCFYMLFNESVLNKKHYQWCWLAVGALNAGLMIMGISLLLAGGLQCYFWRVIGLSIGETNQLLKPYLLFRTIGAIIYTMGSLTLSFIVFKNAWPRLRFYFRSNKINAVIHYHQLYRIQELLNCLVKKEREAEQLLDKIKNIFEQLTKRGHR